MGTKDRESPKEPRKTRSKTTQEEKGQVKPSRSFDSEIRKWASIPRGNKKQGRGKKNRAEGKGKEGRGGKQGLRQAAAQATERSKGGHKIETGLGSGYRRAFVHQFYGALGGKNNRDLSAGSILIVRSVSRSRKQRRLPRIRTNKSRALTGMVMAEIGSLCLGLDAPSETLPALNVPRV